MKNRKRKSLLIVEPGFQIYKEHLIAGMQACGEYDLYFASGLAPSVSIEWTRKYSSGSFTFSYAENNLLEKALDFMVESDVTFSGALTLVDTSVHFVNELQHALGLPTISKYTGKIVRSKRVMRERLLGADIYQPRFSVVQSTESTKPLQATSLRFPLIVKPSEMMSSLGVVKVDSPAELSGAVDKAARADFWDESLRDLYGDISNDVLIEEFVSGPEYSVETFVIGGRAQILGITKKTTTEGKQFDEVGHLFPAEVGHTLLNKIKRMVIASHARLGLNYTITHTEFRVFQNNPYIIEVNCRMGGDLISRLIEHSTSLNMGQFIARVHSGEDVTGLLAEKKTEASYEIQYLTTESEGRVENVPSLSAILNADEYVESASHVQPGDILFRDGLTSVSRLAHIIRRVREGASLENDPIYEELAWKFEIRPLLLATDARGAEDKLLVFAASAEDLEDLIKIEEAAWDIKQRATPQTIRRRLEVNPNSILLAQSLKTGDKVGFVQTVPLVGFDESEVRPWEYYAELCTDLSYIRQVDSPECLYIVSIASSFNAPRGTGTSLIRAVCSLAKSKAIKQVAYGARAPNFSKVQALLDFSSYFRQLQTQERSEAVLKAALNAGGRIVKPIEEYFEDPPSANYGVLVVHDLVVTHES